MRAATLRIESGASEGRRFELGEADVLIGRAPTSDLVLADEGISREHAMVSWEDDHFSIEDLQSTNGTHVNGKRIRTAELADGDRIRLGRTHLSFHLEG